MEQVPPSLHAVVPSVATAASDADAADRHWVEVALAALYRRNHAGRIELLVARRHADAIRGGLWEFPGGKIEPGEAPSSAAVREVEEEVGLARSELVTPLEPLAVVEHSDAELAREKSVRLHAFVVEVKPDVKPEAIGSSEVRWIGLEELAQYPWPRANAAINELLGRRLGALDRAAAPRS